jgi:CRP-like cAMP-binding protein
MCKIYGMTDATDATLGMQLVETRLGRPVAEVVRDAYLVRELPQADIAAELGVDAATVSRWMARFGIQARVIGHRKRRRTAA